MISAHISSDRTQSLKEHSLNSAKIAKTDLSEFGFGNTAYLAALFHDCGKAGKEFQKYLSDSATGNKVKKGSVIHSFAGVKYFLEKYQNSEDYCEQATKEIIAYSIGSHHGLFDINNPDKKNGFTKRMTEQPKSDKESIDIFLNEVANDIDETELFNRSVSEIKIAVNKIIAVSNKKKDEYYFYLGLLCRMITSAVMDGDRTDTANFILDREYNHIYTEPDIREKIYKNVSAGIDNLSCDTDINRVRREMSDICFDFADNDDGIYRLNIPTGGGKTLSSLRFAAAHLLKKNKNRIFYIAPFISILEQNAAEIKKAVGENYVLEHHSDIICDRDDANENNIRKYLEDSWNSPVIATTFVQFANTLFSSKTSCVRRFHSLGNSVIIIDEVQSVPTKMISLFNLAINFLSKICNCTVLLCSATQPCLEIVSHPMIIDKDIIKKSAFEKYATVLKRNDIINYGTLPLSQISEFAINKAAQFRSLLLVCNKKEQAGYLFNAIKPYVENCRHISAGMCVSHRKKTLDEIRDLLSDKKRVVCISTQVIEAGVDISFDCAIRLSAGMDNIVQTAGRCNRNGENDSDSPVYIISCSDEKLAMLPDIFNAKRATTSLIANYENDPDRFSNDLSSDKAVNFYYKKLYSDYYGNNHFDCPIKNMPSLYKMLSDNFDYIDAKKKYKYTLTQSFKTAGDLFNVFDSNSKSVIVPYNDEAKEIIEKIQRYYYDNDYVAFQKEVKYSSQYAVSVFEYQFKKLTEQNTVISLCDGLIYTLSPEYYDKDTGILNEPKEENPCNILIW